MLFHNVRILLDNRVIGYFDAEQFCFLFESVSLYVTSVSVSIIWNGPFWSGCSFLENLFCVVKLAIKTNLPIFKFDLIIYVLLL